MLLIVLIVFMITHVIIWIAAYFGRDTKMDKEALKIYGTRATIGWQISFLASVINSSVNILIYCFKDEQFCNVARQITRVDKVCRRQTNNNELPLGGNYEGSKKHGGS